MKEKKRWVSLFLVLVFMLTVFSRFDYKGIANVQAASQKIKISIKNIKMNPREKRSLKLLGLTDAQNRKVKWSSNKKGVVTVNSKGIVTAKKCGSAVITAKYDGLSYKCKVKVTNAYIDYNSSITTLDTKVSVGVNKKIKVLVYTDNGGAITCKKSNSNVKTSWGNWKNDNSILLTITGVSEGNTVLTVYDSEHPSIKMKINVNVCIPISKISFIDKSVSIVAGETKTLRYKVEPYDASEKGLTWESSNTNIVSVTNSGVITAKNSGTAIITLSSTNGKKATCKVMVKDISIEFPKLPLTYSNYSTRGKLQSACLIESLTIVRKNYYSYNDYFDIRVQVTGTMINTNSKRSCSMAWKLYDDDNVVVKSDTDYTQDADVGDGFKSEILITNLKPGNYRFFFTADW